MAEVNTNDVPTITIDEVAYAIPDLNENARELIGLYQEAQNDMLAARRKSIIAETASNSLGKLVSDAVKEQYAKTSEVE